MYVRDSTGGATHDPPYHLGHIGFPPHFGCSEAPQGGIVAQLLGLLTGYAAQSKSSMLLVAAYARTARWSLATLSSTTIRQDDRASPVVLWTARRAGGVTVSFFGPAWGLQNHAQCEEQCQWRQKEGFAAGPGSRSGGWLAALPGPESRCQCQSP